MYGIIPDNEKLYGSDVFRSLVKQSYEELTLLVNEENPCKNCISFLFAQPDSVICMNEEERQIDRVTARIFKTNKESTRLLK